MLTVGLSVGFLAGWSVGQLLEKHFFPRYLINMAVLVIMISVYVLSNMIHEESLLTVTVMGIVLAKYG